MPDNVTLDAGSGGAVIATDQIGSDHYQKIKIIDGTDESTLALMVVSEDEAHASADTGLVMMSVRTDAAASLAGTTNDYQPLITDATGHLHTRDVSSAAALSGSQFQVDVVAALPAGNNNIGNVDIVSGTITAVTDITNTVTVDNAGTFAVQVVDTSFAVADGSALGEGVLVQGDDGTDRKNINVDASTGDVQVDVTNTVTVDLGANNDVTIDSSSVVKTEDVGASAGDQGIAILAVRRDADTSLVGSTNDYANLQVDVDGALKVEIFDGGDSHTVDNAGTFPIQVVDTSFAVGDGNALGEGVLVQGDDGTDRKNINVDATTGDVQVDVTNTVTVAAHAVTNAGTFPVQIVDTSFAVADGNALGEGVLVQGDDGTDRKNINVDASTGDVQVDVTNTVTVDLGSNNDVTVSAASTGGMSFDMLALAAEDNDKVIKGSAGTLYYISVQSLDATPVYLKLFNATSITAGTTSANLQFMCPANATAANGAGIVLSFSPGIQFGTGIVALIATGVALDNNTAVSANEVVVTLGFE